MASKHWVLNGLPRKETLTHDCKSRVSVRIGSQTLSIQIERGLAMRNLRFGYLALRCQLCRALLAYTLLHGGFCCAVSNLDKAETLMQKRFGIVGVAKLHAWITLLHENQTKSAIVKVNAVNDFFNNNILYEEDGRHWQVSDYWATPMETLGSGTGDCEDYVIAKYFTPIQLGIPVEHLRLIYVKARMGNAASRVYQAHMVLGYYEQSDSIPIILDNLLTYLETGDRRGDLLPVYSFNSNELWLGNHAALHIRPSAQISSWHDMLERMKQEGW